MLKCRQINRRNWARGPLPATPEEVILVASVIGQTFRLTTVTSRLT